MLASSFSGFDPDCAKTPQKLQQPGVIHVDATV
jgi:hypothetical protein